MRSAFFRCYAFYFTYFYVMKCYPIFLTLVLLCTIVTASAQDSLFVRLNGDEIPYVEVRNTTEQSVMQIASQYSVPPAFLADLNGLRTEQIINDRTIRIPIGNYNYRRVEMTGNVSLYYRVQPQDKWNSIARSFNTNSESLKGLNPPHAGELKLGQVIRIGFISCKTPPTHTKKTPTIDTTIIENQDLSPLTLHIDSMQQVMEAQYLQQSGGMNLTEEAGAAVLFESKAPAKPGVFYAFHNNAPRGTIIKVYNPAADKTIYVKVIGRIPELKEYNNAIIGISGKAAPSLGTSYKRTFCKVSY